VLATKTQRIRSRQNFSRRKVVKRNSTHQLSTMTSPLSKPKQNLNPWTHPPVMNLMQAPTSKPTPPELTSYQEQVIREHRLMLKFLRSRSDSCEFACGSEGYTDKWGVGLVGSKTGFRHVIAQWAAWMNSQYFYMEVTARLLAVCQQRRP